jgi:hypothetical protein
VTCFHQDGHSSVNHAPAALWPAGELFKSQALQARVAAAHDRLQLISADASNTDVEAVESIRASLQDLAHAITHSMSAVHNTADKTAPLLGSAQRLLTSKEDVELIRNCKNWWVCTLSWHAATNCFGTRSKRLACTLLLSPYQHQCVRRDFKHVAQW